MARQIMYRVPCLSCKHKYDRKTKCEAFPDGIPEQILFTSSLHLRPLKEQDNKIVYEPKEESK